MLGNGHTRTVCIYNGTLSDCPTAIIDRKARASSSSWLKNRGSTVTASPRGAYTSCIVFSEDLETNTRTGGVSTADSAADLPTHAASQGCE